MSIVLLFNKLFVCKFIVLLLFWSITSRFNRLSICVFFSFLDL